MPTYVQYHNADKLGRYPTPAIDFHLKIDEIPPQDEALTEHKIFTTKKSILKAKDAKCFLIVGKTETIKKYYLWSFFTIEHVELTDQKYYQARGRGHTFKRPILLNDIAGFDEFKKYCGNFGIGFQQIDNHAFTSILNTYAYPLENKLNATQLATRDDIRQLLADLNDKMLNVVPEKRRMEIEHTIRNDKSMVKLLKESVGYKCQFPGCEAKIPTKDGSNYVEVAHIDPVKAGGQSVIGNLVVLCPNHHKEFDLGDLHIQEQSKCRLTGTLNGVDFEIKFNFLE